MIGITFDRSSFDYGAFISKIQPFAQFTFRPKNNLRSNTNDKLQFRYINIKKIIQVVLRMKMKFHLIKFLIQNLFTKKTILKIIKIGILTYKFQAISEKLSFSYERRKRTPKDRHYNLRFFSGIFLFNKLAPQKPVLIIH